MMYEYMSSESVHGVRIPTNQFRFDFSKTMPKKYQNTASAGTMNEDTHQPLRSHSHATQPAPEAAGTPKCLLPAQDR